MNIGELFLLGFRGPEIPPWLHEFTENYGLGGVILFDYDCIDKKYERNIFNPAQVKNLCKEIHKLPSKPLIFIDQEGGKVRRLKESKGFAPLPSAKNFAQILKNEKESLTAKSYKEMKELGIDINLAPVIDLDFNPLNPDIGAVERSFSVDPQTTSECAKVLFSIAKKTRLGLCLKHFPGMGGAKVNAHHDLTDISETISEIQINLFKNLVSQMPTKIILVSHGIVNQWEENAPTSMSKVALEKIKSWDEEIITITDDMQMQGLQKVMSTNEGCIKAIKAGADFLCIGNNLLDEQLQSSLFAKNLMEQSEKDSVLNSQIKSAISKIQKLKKSFQF